MALNRVLDIAGSALNAQSQRLNTTASNLANAGSVSGDPNQVYRARNPVFETVPFENDATEFSVFPDRNAATYGVRVTGIEESQVPLTQRYAPEHPQADENGNVYVTNVNTVAEMVNMISASRAYQSNIEIMTTTKELLVQTLSIGRG
ncbi:MAG: flagellar basal body rod protein FlgC [Pseudomonadota bacterium]